VSQEDRSPKPAVNSLLLAVDDSESTLAGVGVVIDVLSNDMWLDDSPFVIELASLPGNGTTFVTSENIVSYVPSAGFVGVESFRYTLTDRDGDSTQTTVTHCPCSPYSPSRSLQSGDDRAHAYSSITDSSHLKLYRFLTQQPANLANLVSK